MKKPGFDAKDISELRTMAKKAGIIAKRTWEKEDFVKAISDKTSPKTQTLKAAKPKTPAKKSTTSKQVKKKTATIKSAPVEKAPAKSKIASKLPKKPVVKKIKTKAKKQPLKRSAVKPKRKAAVKAAKTTTARQVPQRAAARPPKKSAAVITTAKKPVKKIATIARKPVKALKKASGKSLRTEYNSVPAGQSRNKIVSMSVTPKRIYVYWEITEPAISSHKGSLNLKVVAAPLNVSFYLPVSERIGEHFINVSPGKGYTIEIGVINLKGKFVKISQSQAVTTPIATVQASGSSRISGLSEPTRPGEADRLPDEFFEIPESVSQY
ncbi:MAG TPA: hypothetical protein DD725_08165 [Deltaproteobacteria bacterium]|nr:hypothetical protein [Deltaproteobacteria bacterium]